MPQVAFNYDLWAARYPSLATSVNSTLATAYFGEATIFQRNDGFGPICDATLQLTLLNMLTAHIAILNGAGSPGGVPSGLVGRVANATQGSVSVGTSYVNPTTDLQAWASQTGPGAEWYAATSQFRTFRYRALPRQSLTPGFPGYPGLSGGWYGWRQ